MNYFLSSPSAIQPIYSASSIHHPIELYDGSLKFAGNEFNIEGQGKIKLEWLPSPRLVFELKLSIDSLPPVSLPINSMLGNGTLSFCIADRGILTDASLFKITESNDFDRFIFNGFINQGIVVGSGNNLKFVIFHLVNFHKIMGETIRYHPGHASRSRLVLEAEGWVFTIDEVKEISELIKKIKHSRGYAITHAVKLEQKDGSNFSSEDAKSQIDALYYFLSFARGFYTSPVLLVGHDENDNKIWEEWGTYNTTVYKSVPSWFIEENSHTLAQMFPNFMKYWNDPKWNEAIKTSIIWYVDSNIMFNNINGLIIWVHSALELLFNVYCDNNQITITSETQAYQKIKKLLSELGISENPPPTLTEFVKLAKELKNLGDAQLDGSEVFSRVRNYITHSNPNSSTHKFSHQVIHKTSSEARYEVLTLGLWYVEMILLKLFSYQGQYFNRCSQKEEEF